MRKINKHNKWNKNCIGILSAVLALSAVLFSGCGPFAQTGQQAQVMAAEAASGAETPAGAEVAEAAASAALSAATGGIAGGGDSVVIVKQEEKPAVTVAADHGVTVIPDTAEIRFGVMSQASEAPKAQEENTKIVDKLIEELKKAGVEEKDIRTTGYDMYPRYSNNGQSITGYYVTTNMSVSNQSLEKTGDLLTVCIKAGANQIQGIYYTYSGYNEAYAEALGNAVKAASLKAEAIAAASGRTLGEIIAIQEGYQNTSMRASYQSVNAEAMMAKASAADAVAILPGEVDVSAQVTVTYRLD